MPRTVRFLTVYVKEANPTDSWKGGKDGYSGSGARLPQVRNLDEMRDHARQFQIAHAWPTDVVLDSMAGNVGIAFTGMEMGALWLGVVELDTGRIRVPSKPPPLDYEVGPVRLWLASVRK